MDLNNMPLLAALTKKINWLTARQKVVSENVGNADTPGFKASDLRPLDFRKELAEVTHSTSPKLAPVTTDAHHLVGTEFATKLQPEIEKITTDREINGNTVSLEDEMMKVSETSSDYQLMTNLYKKQVGLIKTAIGRTGS
ncbi:MAG TPA: flagellar basal body rod protein FlgB [Aliidongia sp.]|uniref:flagellar basal body rod protein FlgB n=1 Tax=Aliidongia sp. TaxID=1914230 RepID=UPI002DDD99BA|nr:flagellar basal body rod protein FlgB [Aliidongia sp.]HEV2674230.1 flagellar basal body rod protein FlgB [Aliidongia sp.]